METISRSLLTFLLNSIWQVPLVAAVAWLACRLMRKHSANYRNAVWVAAVVAAILLPVASLRIDSPSPERIQFSPSLVNVAPGNALRTSAPPPMVSSAASARTLSFAQTTASVLIGAYLLFLIFRVGALFAALLRTAQIRARARSTAIPPTLQQVWTRCQEAFGLSGLQLLTSPQVSGPVTAGRAIILPESLLTETSVDVLTTAVGHEMAHIARRDFASNLCYELLLLPIGFHPAVWMMRREIERTREMACDELVTVRLMDPGAYARSIVSIAAGMMALPRPGYTLGVFDGDILEERIRRLLEHPASNLRRGRVLLAGGLTALLLCAVAASTLAITARAQGGAQAILKQGEAAYNNGDYQAASDRFENAVKVEPANVKAKLLLAKALLSDSQTADHLARARQQYLDVLAIDATNRSALKGLIQVDMNSKRFADARQWALKAIQANGSERDAYYTLGFLDWAETYPDYAKARMAAGMRPQDSGIIPDATLRQKVRADHGAQIEDGFRVLQIALQLDPDYSDAMAYMNLLYRIEAGIADTPAESAAMVAKADDWVTKALDARRRMAKTDRPATGPLDVDGPVTDTFVPAPPPPPPPPPPGAAPQARMEAPGAIHINGEALQAKLVRQVPPIYPEMAKRAAISGTVVLSVVISKEGTVRQADVVSGPAALAGAALDAVRQWAWKPTLLNGDPVDVVSTVTINFALSGH